MTRVIVTGGIMCRKLETCESSRRRTVAPAAGCQPRSRSALRVSGSRADIVFETLLLFVYRRFHLGHGNRERDNRSDPVDVTVI